jgi:ABC-2 type transport system permease protein
MSDITLPMPIHDVVPASSTPGGVTTAAAVAGRTLRTFLRSPQLMVAGALSGAMFLLLFLWVFGGAISATDARYIDFLVPGFLAANCLMAALNASAGVATDLDQGVFDRLRSLPVPRVAVLAGRAVADTALLSWNLGVTTLVALVVGFRTHGDIGEVVLAFTLCVLFGFAFTWLAIWLGMVAGSAQAAQGMSMLAFPIGFLSSAYAPVETMPEWLQPIAQHQPVTVMVNAVRALMLGDSALAGVQGSTTSVVLMAVAWALGILVVFVSLTFARFRRS